MNGPFSIVVPLYNKESSVGNSLRSVLSQTVTDFEIVVVDDGSTDRSCQVVEQLSDSRIRLVRKANGGVSSARNEGVRLARHELVAFLDADDSWAPDYLERMDALIDMSPTAALYGCAYMEIHPDGSRIPAKIDLAPGHRGYLDTFFDVNRNVCVYHPSGSIVRKDRFLELGGFDTRLSKGEDWDVWIKFAIAGKIAYLNQPLISYHLDAENRCMNRALDKSRSLLWNLARYDSRLASHPGLERFLDRWRLSHVKYALQNRNLEVPTPRDIDILLSEVKRPSGGLRAFLRMPQAARLASYHLLRAIFPMASFAKRIVRRK